MKLKLECDWCGEEPEEELHKGGPCLKCNNGTLLVDLRDFGIELLIKAVYKWSYNEIKDNPALIYDSIMEEK